MQISIVWVAEAAEGFHFAAKPGDRGHVVDQVFVEDLDRHVVAEPDVDRLIYYPHGPLANPSLDVVVRESGASRVGSWGAGCRPRLA